MAHWAGKTSYILLTLWLVSVQHLSCSLIPRVPKRTVGQAEASVSPDQTASPLAEDDASSALGQEAQGSSATQQEATDGSVEACYRDCRATKESCLVDCTTMNMPASCPNECEQEVKFCVYFCDVFLSVGPEDEDEEHGSTGTNDEKSEDEGIEESSVTATVPPSGRISGSGAGGTTSAGTMVTTRAVDQEVHLVTDGPDRLPAAGATSVREDNTDERGMEHGEESQLSELGREQHSTLSPQNSDLASTTMQYTTRIANGNSGQQPVQNQALEEQEQTDTSVSSDDEQGAEESPDEASELESLQDEQSNRRPRTGIRKHMEDESDLSDDTHQTERPTVATNSETTTAQRNMAALRGMFRTNLRSHYNQQRHGYLRHGIPGMPNA